MRDFASQGLWPFSDAIFNFLYFELAEDNWGKTGLVSIFSYDYFLGKKKQNKNISSLYALCIDPTGTRVAK